MPLLGIDIGGGSVKVACLDGGQMVWSGQSASYSKPDSEQLIAAISDAINERIPAGVPIVAGLCAPGVLDLSKRIITKAVNVPGLTEMTLDELVRRAIGMNAKLNWIGSDAVAAAFDAARVSGLTGRVFSLAIGTGVGAAVLDEGKKPLLVSGHSPGHWGQVDVSLPDEDVIGPDGGAGGLEGYIGSAALRKRFGTDDLAGPVAKMAGDAAPVRALVRAIRIGHAIYRPEHVLLLGGIGIHLAHLSGAIQEQVNRNLTSVARSGWTLNFGRDTWHAARGAGLLAG
jgi:predicted NBD/HSP70 family sugar kinase